MHFRERSAGRLAASGLWLIVFLFIAGNLAAQSMSPRYYDIGSPTLEKIWVDPANGNDNRSGATRAQALRTLTAAWNRIPSGSTLAATGYRLWLAPGVFSEASVPNYWEARHGTRQFPILLQAAEGAGTVTLPSVNMYDCRYVYFIDLSLKSGNDVLHFERCDHILLRRVELIGLGDIRNYEGPQETLKANQCQYLYIEDSDISGAHDNAVDFVAVQHGHIVGNRIHRALDWCMYLKGGSAYFRIEGNEIYDGGAGGFTAGQGTGFQFMTSPWLHYEAYDIKFINNLVHDIEGAGMGVNGGYNILLAYNTLYRIGSRSHVLELTFGGRSCDGRPGDPGRENCGNYLAAGGWGTTVVDDGNNYVRIPNKNVFVYNNIFYNPPGAPSQWQHFHIPAAFNGPSQSGSNAPHPAHADANVQLRGNIIWNGPANHPLGIEEGSSGCQSDNPSCNLAQILAENQINVIEPQLVDPERGNFRPRTSGNLFAMTPLPIPAFVGGDRPQPPLAPEGNRQNEVARDFSNASRSTNNAPGAFSGNVITSVKDSAPADIIEKLALPQNYPNPFNPSTVISFQLSVNSHVTLRVFDVAGREVATLVDGNLAAGNHAVTFSPRDLAGGIYFYKLTAGKFSQTRKAVLMK